MYLALSAAVATAVEFPGGKKIESEINGYDWKANLYVFVSSAGKRGRLALLCVGVSIFVYNRVNLVPEIYHPRQFLGCFVFNR